MPATQYATCTVCSNTNDNRRLVRPSNRPAYYLGICIDCEREREARRRAGLNTGRPTRRRRGTGTDTTPVPTITAERLGLMRKFGVEIECYIPGGRSSSAASRITSQLPTGWRLKGDGSLGPSGVEIVSPPIQGEAGLNTLREVLTILVEAGATVNRRCGLHVHHDAADIGRNGLVLFTRSWAANQNLIDYLVAPSRRNGANSYCRPLSSSELTHLSTWPTASSLREGLPAERYRAVNLHSYSKYGTVEIRQHQGTLSFRKIEGWIKLAQGLMDAVSGRNSALQAAGNLQGLFRSAQLDEDTAAYFLGRAMQFGVPAPALGYAAATEVVA